MGGTQGVNDRIQNEKAFYDRCNLEGAAYGAGKYYAVTRESTGWMKDRLGPDAEGLRVLEYGCGPGSLAFYLARRGARVTGIDISEIAMRRARAKAFREGLRGISFPVMNAEELGFRASAFDMICGTAILHHLDLQTCFRELARTLKPTGKAVFIEPMGHNPLINLYRRLTPRLRTVDEHPLVMSDLELARRHFGSVETRFFHLFALLAVAFRRRRVFGPLLGFLERLDRRLFASMPFARRWAWTCVVILTDPRKDRASPSESRSRYSVATAPGEAAEPTAQAVAVA